MATTDNILSDLIINDLTQEEYDALVASGEVQEGQIYATDGAGSSGGGSTTGGLESVAHDSSLEGAGTTASPLKVASTVIAQINDKADSTVVETLSSVVSENTTKLNTLRNDTDSLGDQVSGIEEKIPSSASATNQLATKADLPIGFDATVVAELPATGEKGIIYLVPKDGEAPDIHDEYIWIDSEQKFEFIGSTAVDLTNYVKNTDYATSDKGGVIKANTSNYGVGMSAGYLIAPTKTLEQYNSTSANSFMSKGTLENIKDDYVKRGITANTTTLTDEEKTAAQDWLGIKQGASLPILMAVWSDHVINDMSWLRADTFSWQSGDVYVAAYEHLVADFAGLAGTQYYAWTRTVAGDVYYTLSASPNSGQAIFYKDSSGNMIQSGAVMEGGSQTIYNDGGDELVRDSTKDETVPQKQTDTIGDITVSYYLAEDGHKICLPDQESNIVALYEATGAADYYLLDTTNKQFKLPRKQKRTLIQAVKNDDGTWYNLYSDGWIEQGGRFGDGTAGVLTVALPIVMSDTNYDLIVSANVSDGSYFGSGYKVSTTEIKVWTTNYNGNTVKQTGSSWQVSGYAAESAYASAGMRLEYYYVGNFTQEAIEQTAGLNAELFNGKADVSRVEVLEGYDYVVESQMPTASNGYTWYRKYKSGWVEQGGVLPMTSPYGLKTVVFPVAMSNTDFTVCFSLQQSSNKTDSITYRQGSFWNLTTTSFDCYDDDVIAKHWQVSGIAAN